MPDRRGLDLSSLPAHIGIIMDGNGRWAVNRGKSRTAGHREGLKAAKRVVKAASDLGVKFFTLYAFSTENWTRSTVEVSFLMALIRIHLSREIKFYRENRIRVIHSGDRGGLPKEVLKELRNIEQKTASNDGLTVNLAVNYGGRNEIVRAVNRWLSAGNGKREGKYLLSEEDLAGHLDHPELPNPDLIIRTGREMRTSNFLIWEGTYSELYFSYKMWPDWHGTDLFEAIQEFQNRQRRYGGTS